MSRLRAHLTYANVMATVAVFMALGSGAYAAIQLPKNSVKAPQIAKNAVRSAEVKNRSLRAVDLRRGLLLSGPRGPEGPQGPQGPLGLTGPAGSPAASMLMGTVDNTGVFESTNTSATYPPLGVLTSSGQPLRTPNHTVVLRDLLVRVDSEPGPGATRTFELGVPPLLMTCSISGTANDCNSGAQTVTLPPGTPFRFAISNGSVAPADTDVDFAYRAVTP